MASFSENDEARQNRLASMTDNRPEGEAPGPARPSQYQGRTQLREACSIRLDRIVPDPNQPRTEFDPEVSRSPSREPPRAWPAPANPGPLG